MEENRPEEDKPRWDNLARLGFLVAGAAPWLLMGAALLNARNPADRQWGFSGYVSNPYYNLPYNPPSNQLTALINGITGFIDQLQQIPGDFSSQIHALTLDLAAVSNSSAAGIAAATAQLTSDANAALAAVKAAGQTVTSDLQNAANSLMSAISGFISWLNGVVSGSSSGATNALATTPAAAAPVTTASATEAASTTASGPSAAYLATQAEEVAAQQEALGL